jgi:hypothetical protein
MCDVTFSAHVLELWFSSLDRGMTTGKVALTSELLHSVEEGSSEE